MAALYLKNYEYRILSYSTSSISVIIFLSFLSRHHRRMRSQHPYCFFFWAFFDFGSFVMN